MKKTDSTYIVIGKFAATSGVQGWIRIRPYTEFGADILDYLPWYINSSNPDNHDNAWTPIPLESGRIQGNGLIAKIKDIDTPEKARLLTGKLIAVNRSLLPSPGENEYYWSDLLGLTVRNKL